MASFNSPSYLAAIIDGEGCVSKLWMDGNVVRGFHVTVSNTESDIIIATCSALEDLGIWYTVHQRGSARKEWSHSYVVSIARRADLAKLLDLVPIQHGGKLARLQEIVASPQHKDLKQTDFFPDQLVRDWYANGMTQREIGNWLGIKTRTLSGLMDRYGIESRGRGTHIGRRAS